MDDETQHAPRDRYNEGPAEVQADGIAEIQVRSRSIDRDLVVGHLQQLIKLVELSEQTTTAHDPDTPDTENVTVASNALGELPAVMETARPSMPPHPLESLTPRQQRIFDFLRVRAENQLAPPNLRMIGEAVGLVSPSTVEYQLRLLVKKGYLLRSDERWILAAPEESAIIRRDT